MAPFLKSHGLLLAALCLTSVTACGDDEAIGTTPGSGGSAALDAALGDAGTDVAQGGTDGAAEDATSDAADAADASILDASPDAAEASVDAAVAIMPDFTLSDENATSATYQKNVSPRDHLGKVSAWYFGHAT